MIRSRKPGAKRSTWASIRSTCRGPAAALGDDLGDRRRAAHAAAELLQARDERLCQPPGAALGAGPADRVSEEVQVRRRDRTARAVRRDVAVHRRAVQPGARALAVEE